MKLLIVFNAAGLILFWTMFCFTHTVSVAGWLSATPETRIDDE